MKSVSWVIKGPLALEHGYSSTRNGLILVQQWLEYVRGNVCWIEALRAWGG